MQLAGSAILELGILRSPRWVVTSDHRVITLTGMGHTARIRLAVAGVIGALGAGAGIAYGLVLARPPAPFADVASGVSPPPFYVDGGNSLVVVRATATGDKTGSVWAPHAWAYMTHQLQDAVAGSADGKVFVAAFVNDDTMKTALFRFSLTSSGRVTGLHLIPHSVIPGLDQVSLAVSPDGTWAAVSGTPLYRAEAAGSQIGPRGQASIMVINIRTGRRVFWRGGLRVPGRQLTFPSLSFGSDDSLYVVAQWCQGQVDYFGTVACAAWHSPPPLTKLMLLDAASRGGSLAGARPVRVVSARFPLILQAVAADAGEAIVALVREGRQVSVVELDARTGRLDAVLYRHRSPTCEGFAGPCAAFLAVDGTGRFVFLSENFGRPFGWLHAGRFHALSWQVSDIGQSAW